MKRSDPRKRRVRQFAVGISLMIVGLSVVALWRTGSRAVSGPLAQAEDAYNEGRWARAAELARQALKSHKEDASALRILARSSARLGHHDSALGLYSHRLDEQALAAEDYLLLGLAQQRSGHAEAAERSWNKALDAPHITSKLVEELARLHIEGHRPAEAIRAADRLSRQPGWEARGLMMLGIIKAAMNDVRGADDSFRRALELDSGEIDKSADPNRLRKLIVRTSLQSGQPRSARTLLGPIMAGGTDPEAAWLLSRAFLQEGDVNQASGALERSGNYRAEHPLENEPSPYVGEASCEKCHATIFRDSLGSRHTQSFYRGTQLGQLPVPAGPLLDPDDPKVSHAFRRENDALWAETKVGAEVYRGIVEYAFGTSDRYLTMVSRDAQGAHRIARLSYYETREGRGWDRTILDSIDPSHGPATDFQGQTVGVRDGVVRCLYCHMTNPRAAAEPTGPEAGDRAIGCERCHGPGGNHVAAIQARFRDLAIVNPTAVAPATVTTRQCNDCHILDTSFPTANRDNPGWVRSQGVGWTWSRCNTESGGALGCVSCHDPHKSAKATSTAEYEAKCRECHAGDTARPSRSEQVSKQRGASIPRSRTCPVDQEKGCVNCHMPRVQIGLLHQALTDHFIRVERTNH
jgi:predicted CXXCH cytochrome family protein